MNEQLEKMDRAAELAAKEIKKTWTAMQISVWYRKWYMSAGYKRLTHILWKVFPVKEE